MASSGKKKTTMAKLTRESRLRERRLDKQARKDARKHALAHPPEPSGDMPDAPAGAELGTAPAGTVSEQPALEGDIQTPAEA
jgi:hypothetical protein